MFSRVKNIFQGWVSPKHNHSGYVDLGKGRQAAFVGGTGVLHHKRHNISGKKMLSTFTISAGKLADDIVLEVVLVVVLTLVISLVDKVVIL